MNRSLHRRHRVESCWVLNADDLPHPPGAGAEGRLVVTTREGASPVEIGYLIRNDGDGLLLEVFLARTPADAPLRFRLDRTPLRFGGQRTYLLCPGCGCRGLKLYWPFSGQAGFGCRGCHQLAYRSSAQRHRSAPRWRAIIEAPRPAGPTPAPAWRRYERLRSRTAGAPPAPNSAAPDAGP